MMTSRIGSHAVLLCTRAIPAGCLLIAACAADPTRSSLSAPAADATPITEHDPMPLAPSPVLIPAPGQSVRVAGDTSTTVTGSDGDFRSGKCRIDTPLPVGYPKPTPPGAIELKTYPSVRLAAVSGTGNPDRGMNRAFWPLFNHIKGHDIAMTSPVEMNYQTLPSADDNSAGEWSMAFLYREPNMNKVGVEGSVTVRDAASVTVVAVGLSGNYSMKLVNSGMREIEDWLAANPQWKAAGSWRTLYYNGPTLFFWNKWAEVQIPVVPATEADRRDEPETSSPQVSS